jgi:predicted PurR-regulated permease PerM
VIVPKVYGHELRLSTLTVILSLGAAAAIAGVVGAVLVLPIVAAIPIIERDWFQNAIGEDAVEDHAELERSLEEKDSSAVRRVIEGEEHPDGGAPPRH